MRKELKTGTEAAKQNNEAKDPSLYDRMINALNGNSQNNSNGHNADQAIVDSQAQTVPQQSEPKKGVMKNGECVCEEGGGQQEEVKETKQPQVEKEATEEVKPLDEGKKPLTLEEIKDMEAAEAGEQDDGGGGDLLWTPHGYYRVPDSIPRDLGIFWKNIGEYNLYLPPPVLQLIEMGEIPPEICIPPELQDDCAKVFESGLKCGSDHQLHPCDIKPTYATGNLLANDTLAQPGHITQITFEGNVYTPDENGVIKVNTGHSILLVYTENFSDPLGNHVAGDYFYLLYDNVSHPCEQGKNIITEVFTYTVGNDNCPAEDQADLIIKIKDDVPKAFDDPTKCVDACGDKASGNVICNDVPGADKPIKVVSFTYDDCTRTAQVPEGGSTTVTTALGGILTVFSNGDWCYTPPKAQPGECNERFAEDGFKYTISDSDCDLSSAEQKILVKFPPAPDANDDCNVVYESGLHPCDCKDTKPTEVRGNLLCNDKIKGDTCITEICFNGKVYKAINGVITVDTPLGLLQVFTKDIGNHKAGDYIYKLQDNACGDDAKEIFKYTLESKDCCDLKDSADLTIKIVDAEPKAENDPAQCVMGCEKKIDGNVLANDCSVDDIRVKSFTYNNGKDTAYIEDGKSTTVTTKLGGILTVNSNGEWCYISPKHPGNDCPEKVEDGFKYTLIDCDGDKSSAEQPIKVLFPPAPDAKDDCDIVYESGLPCGSDQHKPTEAKGNLLANDDVKGDACITEICFNGKTYKPGQYGVITVNTENGILKVYTQDYGSGKNKHEAGDYVYILKDNANHPNDAGKNIIQEEFDYKLESKDCCDNGDKATLTIKIVDDVPCAQDDCAVKVSKCEKVCGNVLANDHSGADKPIKVTSITYNNGCNTANIPLSGHVTVTTLLGALLTVYSDGTWSYEAPKKIYADCDMQDGFKYTISDSDKDLSSAEQPILVQFNGHKDESCKDDCHSGPVCQPPVDHCDDKPKCDDDHKPPVCDEKPHCEDKPPVHCEDKPPVICEPPKPPVCDKPKDCDKPNPKDCKDDRDQGKGHDKDCKDDKKDHDRDHGKDCKDDKKDKDCDKLCDNKDHDKDCKDDKHDHRDHGRKDDHCDDLRICGNAIKDCDHHKDCNVVSFKYYNEHNQCVESQCGQLVTTRSGAKFTMYQNGDYEHTAKDGKSFEDHISFKTNDKTGHKAESKFSIHTEDRTPDFRGEEHHKDKGDDYLVDARDASPRMKISMEDIGMRFGRNDDSDHGRSNHHQEKSIHGYGLLANHGEGEGHHSSYPLVQIEHPVEHHIQQVQHEVHVIK